MRAFISNCVILFVCMPAMFTVAHAQTPLDPKNISDFIMAMDTSMNGLDSWKSVGILTHKMSPLERAALVKSMQDRMKKSGVSQSSIDKQSVVSDTDTSKMFFVALKGENALYAEKDTKETPSSFTPDESNFETLDSIISKGTCTVTHGTNTYDVSGEKRNRSKRVLSKFYPPPAATVGFYIANMKLTPRDAVNKYGFQIVAEKNHEKFGKITVFSGKHPFTSGYKLNFSVAPEYGYRVVHSEIQLPNGKPGFIGEMKSLEKVQGYWLPTVYEELIYNGVSNEPVLKKRYTFYNHTVNDVSDKLLNVELSAGDYVWDESSKATYKVGAGGELIFEDVTGRNRPQYMWPGWLFTASVTTLLVLTVFAYVRWKRKQWAKRS